ncbi:MAG: ABC transporter permease [Peptococcaceae bacterium]|nr:ABC transporter permease [Peptococcaceae bacterium]
MQVRNRKTVRRLAWRSLRASRTRNIVAVLAIALTAMLFTALLTIALSINEGFQQSNFRQVGGDAHASFKYLTDAEFDTLKDDALIERYGARRFLGMVEAVPFNKSHVEVSYSDANAADFMFASPTTGRLPKEGTSEAATDTRVLALLGITPKIGAEFTLPINVDGHETTQTFTLCGYWDYDEAIIASHVFLPESRVKAILDDVGVDGIAADGMTGSLNMDFMLASGSRHIGEDTRQIITNAGYQYDDPQADDYIDYGVNWGYTGAQLVENMDATTLAMIGGMLALILFTGYLIIYNVFQISVAGDIRFYGLLKTIGTTPRQLRRIIRQQALVLSAAGIPLGLVGGWIVGRALVPVVVHELDGVVLTISTSPWIFAFAALFALVTVFISCLRPGRLAGRVSPVEAVRYSEGAARKRGQRKKTRVSVLSMAVANLGRSRGKTVVTILSLALAVVLLTATVTLVRGFDMDRYISSQFASDFQIASAGYFQTTGRPYTSGDALPASATRAVENEGGITDGGATYFSPTDSALVFTPEQEFRALYEGFGNDAATVDALVKNTDQDSDGNLATNAMLYGMSDYALNHLTLLDGDLAPLYDADSHAIAAVYAENDYGDAIAESAWAKVGDKITVRYVSAYDYVGESGTIYASESEVPEDEGYTMRVRDYVDETYTVCAEVAVPNSLSYRYSSSYEYVLGADAFCADSGTENILYYAWDEDDAQDAAMNDFLEDYTTTVNPLLDYQSKATYAAEFESLRNMFALLGGALSAVVAVVGVLNFFNAILTGITSRRREFAMLEAVGMTRGQLSAMLAAEGLLYTLGALALALVLVLASAPLMASALPSLLWFLSYRLTLWPIAAMLPIFAAIGIGVPLLAVRQLRQSPVVERLRQE